jgi:Chaperone of endosialidase
MKPHLKSRHRLLLIPFTLACFALSPGAQAVVPPPDGGYPNANTAEGDDALFSLTTGANNTAMGFDALYSNTGGNENTATGGQALYSNTTGGDFNTATGFTSLTSNLTGTRNTGTGHQSLFSNTTGARNTGTGFSSLYSNTTGFRNAATGWIAMFSNTSGFQNTADGGWALGLNTTGSNNIGLGIAAGYNLTTGDNNIDIGNVGVAGESDTIRIGTVVAETDPIGVTHAVHTATFIAGIYQANIARGLVVKVDSTGHLGTVGSSERFKEAIKPMDKTSEAILALKPVTFHYKKEIDPEGTPEFGLVAEQVEKVNPDLVARDAEGKVYSVRYEAVNAMLLNEFLKEHRKVQKLEASVAQMQKDFQSTCALQQKEITALTATLKDQASQIQKVSAQLEASKPAPQVVNNNQ